MIMLPYGKVLLSQSMGGWKGLGGECDRFSSTWWRDLRKIKGLKSEDKRLEKNWVEDWGGKKHDFGRIVGFEKNVWHLFFQACSITHCRI